MYRSLVVVAVWVYLPQFDAHDHPQLSFWYQGADWGLTGKLNNLDLQRGKDNVLFVLNANS